MNRTQKWQKIALKRGLIMGDMKKQNDALEQQNRDLVAALQAIHDWCETDHAADVLPFEPPWYQGLRDALGKVGE